DIHLGLLRVQDEVEKKMHEQGLTLDMIFNQAPIGIAVSYSKDTVSLNSNKYLNINPTFERITGRTKEELIDLGWAAITHPDDLEKALNNYKKLKSGEINGYSMDKRFVRPDGSNIWVHITVVPLKLTEEHEYNHIALVQDITERKTIEQALIESERSKSILLSNLPGLAYRCKYDREWTMQFVSSGCYDLTGYVAENLINNRNLSFSDLISPEYREHLWNEWKRVLTRHRPFRYEYEITTAGGERKWVLEIGQGIFNDKGEVEALEGIIIDISDRKRMENILTYNSEHDELTGLYNRRYLESVFKNDIKTQTTGKRALISLNLSDMHSLSITYGFQYSQDLIKRIAKELERHCGDRCMLFYTYEYRFVIYYKNYKDKQDLSDFCKKISNTLDSLLTSERISMGIGVLEIDKEIKYDFEELLKNLLIASEEALNPGGDENNIYFYNKELEERKIRREILRRELSEVSAGENSERLFLQYQPILDLHKNRICEFEALARFNSDKLGRVPPLEFIPIAEETKHIISIGNYIINQAFDFIIKLKHIGYDDVSIAINISAIQLLNKDFVENLIDIIKKKNVNPEYINIELTESVFSSRHDEINKILRKLSSYGIKSSIDDFGTGYSSLSRERDLEVDYLKIDKSFIDKLLFLNPEETVTGDIISMAHRMGHQVVAEGVEQEKQMQYLKAHGCDKIQGYLISKPLDEEAAIEFLKTNRFK
ncbi:MAG: EAL and GGDEF domain-containing protein, partial [Acetivibrionales bacterium]